MTHDKFAWNLLGAVTVYASFSTGCGPAKVSDALTTSSVQQAVISTPAGMGHYCSLAADTHSGWAFYWDTAGNDPCEEHVDNFYEGRILRAGLFSAEGENHVVVRCDNNFVETLRGQGTTPLSDAAHAAMGQENCVFTVAPKNMPIFDSPFSLDPYPNHYVLGNAFDFQAEPTYQLSLQTTSCQPEDDIFICTQMNNRGQDRTCSGFLNNHLGHDYIMDTGQSLYAVAAGVVLKARNIYRDGDHWPEGSTSHYQEEVYIEHSVGTSARYREKFVSVYYHMDTGSLEVSDNDVVTQGQLIGEAGSTGNSTAPHLHLSVVRTTNTAYSRYANFQIYTDIPTTQNTSNAYNWIIDPYGWDNQNIFDPRGYLVYPHGALSINLWNSGQAPDLGGW